MNTQLGSHQVDIQPRMRRTMPFFWWTAEAAKTKAAEMRAVLTVVPGPDDNTGGPKAA